MTAPTLTLIRLALPGAALSIASPPGAEPGARRRGTTDKRAL